MASSPLQIPPLSFALVSPGVYRSGCPMPLNFPFLARLRLKSIIYLADQDLPADLQQFTAENGVHVFHFRVHHARDAEDTDATSTANDDTLGDSGYENLTAPASPDGKGEDERKKKKKKKKEDKQNNLRVVENDAESVTQALELLLDSRNFPVLIHSNKGKHRSGVLVACMRKSLQNWAFGSVKSEYHYFAGEKGKADIEFIEQFRPTLEYDERWAPDWMRESPGESALVKVIKAA
ncbi:hypothetical protein DRE_06000 [Drechslerella stenobrocha 248]|uniref:Tyrosine-protein phosphatase n=1 Tax=Drechslerella stenobrocha 248 TaxID=1043628 RepID=W7HZ88_9PEZI|nr:hypothetical protein DRE_06000 [Drechslerella stenobrocha 248]